MDMGRYGSVYIAVGVAGGEQCSLLRLAEPQPRRLCDLGHPRSQHAPSARLQDTCRGSIYIQEMRSNNERKKDQVSRGELKKVVKEIEQGRKNDWMEK